MSFVDENQDIEMQKKEDEIRTRHPVYEDEEDERITRDQNPRTRNQETMRRKKMRNQLS